MPVLETKGALSAQGYGLTTPVQKNYIEDVFSTWLYTGTDVAQTITNNINLSGKGGLVWIKVRNATNNNLIFDTNRGANNSIFTDLTNAQFTGGSPYGVDSFGTTGFILDGINGRNSYNSSGFNYASWTFRKQPKFFDIVTYTGDGSFTRNVAHNLGAVPGFIIIKATSATGNWYVAARSSAYGGWFTSPSTSDFGLNLTSSTSSLTSGTLFTASTVGVNDIVGDGGSNAAQRDKVNANGVTYVMYLFANNAGGFGATGADNAISCNSYTGNGSATGPVVTLGYEPQWLLIKRTSATSDWNLIDNMRGFAVGGANAELNPNLSNAESTGAFVTPTATGFQLNTTDTGYNANGNDYIYIAIRRGPMKTPTVGTSVFSPITRTGTGANATISGVGFAADLLISDARNSGNGAGFFDRLRGGSAMLRPANPGTAAEGSNSTMVLGFNNTSISIGADSFYQSLNTASMPFINWILGRAPGFFDVVCYTGTGANRTIAHNLGVVPELMIMKSRNEPYTWAVYSSSLANTQYLVLNTNAAVATGATRWNSTTPTSTVFSVGTDNSVNANFATYIAYLFATVAGVSKVGTFTGTGATLTVNCGFTTGARFVLIKRTDAVGDWYVWDSARGIVAGNDSYLLLNSTAAEVTITDWVDTASSGFELSNSVGNLVNVVGGTYIFLAIA
jgi:hypothetical protein